MPSTRRSALAAAALTAALALTATACGPSDDNAAGSDKQASAAATSKGGDDFPSLPKGIPAKDLEKWKQKWKSGAWKNWDKDQWLREAHDFINPIIKGHWKPDTMKDAHSSDKTLA
ncbi:hypothetical protein GCM10020000_20900 [Streptomyces olivoverticillatus]